jgi:hypothetical protein
MNNSNLLPIFFTLALLKKSVVIWIETIMRIL